MFRELNSPSELQKTTTRPFIITIVLNSPCFSEPEIQRAIEITSTEKWYVIVLFKTNDWKLTECQGEHFLLLLWWRLWQEPWRVDLLEIGNQSRSRLQLEDSCKIRKSLQLNFFKFSLKPSDHFGIYVVEHLDIHLKQPNFIVIVC